MMTPEIIPIMLPMPYRLGSVNCYLIKTDAGFLLVDTGVTGQRAALVDALQSAGCRPGDLALIIITHGDFDHTGNAAYLRQTSGANIAMHRDDLGMAERGDMFSNRGSSNFLLKTLAPLLFGFGKAQRFTPDLYLEAGSDLSEYGFEAQILSIPGHSKGSIGILTATGDLFCGDLLDNTAKPTLNSIIADSRAANDSLERLLTLDIQTIYPGHGRPFSMQLLRDELAHQGL